MKTYYILFASLFLLASDCGNKPVVEECLDDACFMLSDLETRVDYYLPFILYNDKDEYPTILLNGQVISLDYGKSYEFTESGFYELELKGNTSDDVYLFTLGTEEREHAEWGIPQWVPKTFTAESSFSGEVTSIYPRRYLPGIDIPFIFYATQGGQRMEGYLEASGAGHSFNVKHGVGSVLLSTDQAGNPQFNIGGQQVDLSLQEAAGYTHELSGTYEEPLVIPENSVVHISGNVYLSGSSASLQIGAGSLVLVDEAINIYNDYCAIQINGTASNPVLITCSESGKYWGGFISGQQGAPADLTASYAIFCRSGYHDTGEYESWGHARRQGLFYTVNSSLSLDHCYMTDHIGQVFYPIYAEVELSSVLVQRAKTSGQLNYSTVTITGSTFTDFPDDSYTYLDDDNDALYINHCDARIDSCIFMFAKDDGMDSGGNDGGTVEVSNTRFEACFHEGAALSSVDPAVKSHTFRNCTFFNCGQGLELGFSSPHHTVTIDNCRFLDNGIGIRYGDNYTWSSINGTLYVNNSQSLNNSKDVWNMVRSHWSPKLDHMIFSNVQVSQQTDQYPGLEVIDN